MRAKAARPADIELLFKELKNRSPHIRDLFAHQADTIREYSQNHLSSRDVSLELPTGSGKTLVGLLIAEFRRQIYGERILYLCPTKQLAHQVLKHSKEYGVDARLFVGPKKEYNPHDLTLYRSAKTIAVSTYSGLFNVSPGLNDPQLIVLDDAHSAETYVASMWSLEIERERDADLYDGIFEIFMKDLPSDFVIDLVQESRPQPQTRVEKVPSSSFYRNIAALRQLLDSHIPSPDSELYFQWSVVRKGLHACHVYVSWDQFLIRPYIPPTLTHQPFANATQRIYMSATLGSGGELERITGVGKINRIPTPKTYASHGIGRRLFLFPDFGKDPNEYEPWIAEKTALASRTLALCPTKLQAGTLRNIINLWSPPPSVLSAGDIEESMEPFVRSKHAVLLLTRYDGIDLPQEDCRQLMIYGLPTRTNLQETFLEDRLGLEVLLRERIKTRIAQAAGRCTRSDTDYAVVIMVGRPLLDFCTRKENQDALHPELRAEIKFALDQEASELWRLDAMYKSFLNHDDKWDLAEQDIAQIRSASEPPDTVLSGILASGIQKEVEFAYALWGKDYAKAVEYGRAVVDQLSGPRPVAPYAALWCYFIGSVALEEARTNGRYKAIADDFLNRAREACKTISWFSHALKSASTDTASKVDATQLQAMAVEGIQSVLTQYGAIGPRFQRRMNEVETLLHSTRSKEFDSGLRELGSLLGYKSWKPEGDATPDCIWQPGEKIAFLLEGKAEESPDSGISVEDCRQSSGHINWAKGEERLKDVDCFSVLVTPRSRMDPDALVHADAVFLWNISGVVKLFERVKQMLFSIRSVTATKKQPELRDLILEKLVETGLTPETIKAVLLAQPLSQVPAIDK